MTVAIGGALAEALTAKRPGQAVTAVTRHAEELTVHLTLGELPGD